MSDNSNDFRKFCTLTDYYYQICPGRIMPLFLLYLAKEGQLEVGDRARDAVGALSPDKKYSSHVYAQFTQADAKKLAVKDPAGRHLLDRWECNDNKQISLLFHYDFSDPVLQNAREVFQKHDEVMPDSMEKRRVLFLYSQGLLALGQEYLKEYYVRAAAYILDKCGFFPKSEDYALSMFESMLIGEVAEGTKAYHADATTPFTAAIIGKGNWDLHVEGKGCEIVKAAASLIFEGENDSVSYSFVDKPFKDSTTEHPYDLIVSNCKKTDKDPDKLANIYNVYKKGSQYLSNKGIFIAIDDMKIFFNSTCRRRLFRDAVDENKISKIIILPRAYDSVLTVIDNSKESQDIELIDLLNDSINVDKLSGGLKMLFAFSKKTISSDQLKKARYSVGNFFKYQVDDLPGMKTVPLGHLLNRIEKSSSSLGMMGLEQDNLRKFEYYPEDRYSPFCAGTYGAPSDDICLYEPSYLLYKTSLIVKNYGDLEPYVFKPKYGPAFLKDGLAFGFKPNVSPFYIINELRKEYMHCQLKDWTKSSKNMHSEDEVLSLMIRCPFNNDGNPDVDKQTEIVDRELDANNLPVGQHIYPSEDDKYYYIITEPLGSGSFSINYLADMLSDTDLSIRRVVLKEFFVRLKEIRSERDENNVTIHSVGSIDDILKEADESAEKRRFIDEAAVMRRFGRIKDSHIRPAFQIFTCQETNNIYYVTKYYKEGNLSEFVNKYGGSLDEEEAINRIVIPLSKALFVLHSNRYLHLDLKPANVLIDDDGCAVLSDFGISKEYDNDGKEVTHGQKHSRYYFSPVDDFKNNPGVEMTFHPELDIYALGGIFYYALTGRKPNEFDPEIIEGGISPESLAVLRSALAKNPEERTKDVMDFVHGLKGHEEDDFSYILNTENK